MKMLHYQVVFFLVMCKTCYARRFYHIPLPLGVVGPESIAFDCGGRGPYVGVSDGRILRWEGAPSYTWTGFATMPTWFWGCMGACGATLEQRCGRPLGLKFQPNTCELYVADAYNGLVLVGSKGGRGVSMATSAEGIPFKFTNSLDIDPESGVVYFTDSSTRFERWEFEKVFDSADNTGRLMSYNPHNQTVEVLLHNLQFANGVALNQNNEFVLVSETTTGQIYKFWLKGPRYHTSYVLVSLRGRPDNINRDSNGNFWVAQVPLPCGQSGDGGMPVRIDEQGHILERLDAASGELVTIASDVKEFRGRLWIGNVIDSFFQVSI